VPSPPIDLSGPFRGSLAVARGLLTAGQLRGPRFRRLLPDIYAPTDREPDLMLRSRAAYLLVEGGGALAGYSAAELLDASCGPPGAAPTVLMFPGRQRHACPGLVVRRASLCADELVRIGRLVVTSPVRTAFDLARWAPTLTEKVVAVDALAYRHEFTVDDVRKLARRHLGVHGGKDLPSVLRLADPRSESPMETRIRVALQLSDLPSPVLQYPVAACGRTYRLDLAYPQFHLAVEYDGREHRTPERAARDLRREAALTRQGWTVLRFDAFTVLNRPALVVASTRTELRLRGLST
jgi:very-short-patch-repair endonuclease